MTENTPPTISRDLSLSPFELVTLFAKKWKQLVGISLGVGVVTLGVTFLIPPTYTASTTLMPPAQQSSNALSMLAGQLGALGGLAAASTGMKNPVDQYVSLLKSRNVADSLIAKFKLKELYDAEFMQDAREELADHVRITAGRKDGLITIEADDHDPKRATDLANAFVDELSRVTTEFAVGEASQRRVFFGAQLKSAKDSLADAEETLATSGVPVNAINVTPQSAVAGVARLKAQITTQEVKIASMRGFVARDNPDLRQAETELAALRTQLDRAEVGEPANAERSKYTEKYRDFKYNELLFEMIAKQYELARLDEAREGALIQVIDVAVVPEKKTKPKRGVIAATASAMTGILLSLLFVLQHLGWGRRRFA